MIFIPTYPFTLLKNGVDHPNCASIGSFGRWPQTFFGMIGALAVGCASNTATTETQNKETIFTSVSASLKIESQEEWIERTFGSFSKFAETDLDMDNIFVGMKFPDFGSEMQALHYSGEEYISATHYAGENVNCLEMSTTSSYRFTKLETKNGLSVLYLVEATKCVAANNKNSWLLEEMPKLEIYEIKNAKNQ